MPETPAIMLRSIEAEPDTLVPVLVPKMSSLMKIFKFESKQSEHGSQTKVVAVTSKRNTIENNPKESISG